jgi:hypothetical protein|uniref:Uncharacterized protein n=1 Tax=viral metagenome TaxID=1070528 RepID=A0A6C0E5E5_9ZZZZ
MITISDNLQSFSLDKRGAINLELKLNVTKYGRVWRPIGDALYNYGVSDDEVAEYTVTSEQYTFLQMLNTKPGWEACRDLS